MRFLSFSCAVLLGCASTGHAGLYYSGETFADLPSQWRGFLLDQRNLRSIAVPPIPGNPIRPLRERYLAEADKLAKKASLNADEIADLGAIYLRLGEVDKAIARAGAGPAAAPRAFPHHRQSWHRLAAARRSGPGRCFAWNRPCAWLRKKTNRPRAASQARQAAAAARARTSCRWTISSAFAMSATTGDSNRANWPPSRRRSCRPGRSAWSSSWPCGCRPTARCSGNWRNWPTPTATSATPPR